jgi:hypothetical protein
MHDSALDWVYRLAKDVHATGNDELIHQWRKLQTSDHFYYMCTKFWSDGDVHKYFSAYNSPHEAYVYIGNILTDLELTLDQHVSRQVDAVAASQAPTQRTKKKAAIDGLSAAPDGQEHSPKRPQTLQATNLHQAPKTAARPKKARAPRP